MSIYIGQIMKSFKEFLQEENFNTPAFCVGRQSMPQIEDNIKFVDFLKQHRFYVSYDVIDASLIKPTQVDFDQDKVDNIIDGGQFNSNKVIVSSDGYLLDGHHRYLAALQTGSSIGIIRVDTTINTLLKVAIDYTENSQYTEQPND
jgi:hypothetical protein